MLGDTYSPTYGQEQRASTSVSGHRDQPRVFPGHLSWCSTHHPGPQPPLFLSSGSPPTKRQRRSRGRPSGGARRRRRGGPAAPRQQQEPARPASEGKVTCGKCLGECMYRGQEERAFILGVAHLSTPSWWAVVPILLFSTVKSLSFLLAILLTYILLVVEDHVICHFLQETFLDNPLTPISFVYSANLCRGVFIKQFLLL